MSEPSHNFLRISFASSCFDYLTFHLLHITGNFGHLELKILTLDLLPKPPWPVTHVYEEHAILTDP